MLVVLPSVGATLQVYGGVDSVMEGYNPERQRPQKVMFGAVQYAALWSVGCGRARVREYVRMHVFGAGCLLPCTKSGVCASLLCACVDLHSRLQTTTAAKVVRPQDQLGADAHQYVNTEVAQQQLPARTSYKGLQTQHGVYQQANGNR